MAMDLQWVAMNGNGFAMDCHEWQWFKWQCLNVDIGSIFFVNFNTLHAMVYLPIFES
jgi:hypothetical protein